MMGMRCVIVGGSGGIGAALVRHLAAREHVEAVYATRSEEHTSELQSHS